jgi:hypothetical protein
MFAMICPISLFLAWFILDDGLSHGKRIKSVRIKALRVSGNSNLKPVSNSSGYKQKSFLHINRNMSMDQKTKRFM